MVFLVALVAFAPSSSIDAEAPLLAGDLGITAYDARLLLASGPPSIVLRAADANRARAVHATLVGRGHLAAAAAGDHVPSSAMMFAPRRFRLDDTGMIALDKSGADASRMDFAEMLCMVRATHRRSWQTVVKTEERKFDVGKSLMSGGLMNMKTVTTTSVKANESRENVLYVVRASVRHGWILRESGLDYAGLGASMAPTQPQNFTRLAEFLRVRAPGAFAVPIQAPAEPTIDAIVHLVSLAVSGAISSASGAPRSPP